MHVKVLSWNIWKGTYLEDVISYLQKADADIIGLQEVTERKTKEGYDNIGHTIAKRLGYSFYYHKTFTTDRHTPPFDLGNAILTRLPLEKTGVTFLSDESTYKNDADTEPRNMVSVDVAIDHVALHVANTHLGYSLFLKPSVLRGKQIETLLASLPKEKTVLMGDFNSDIMGQELKPLRDVLKSADPAAIQPTWSVYPHIKYDFKVEGLEYRIDNIYVTKDVKIVNFEVGVSKASDHLPVMATLEI